MCLWVGSHAPSYERQLSGLPSRVEYLSRQGLLLPRVYGTPTSPRWLELRGPAAWPPGLCAGKPVISCFHCSGDVCQGPRCSLAGVRPVALEYCSCRPPDGSAGLPKCVRALGCRPLRPVLCCPRCMCVCGVLAHLAPVHGYARCVQFACAVGGCFAPPPIT